MSTTRPSLLFSDNLIVGDMFDLGGVQYEVFSTTPHGNYNTILTLKPTKEFSNKGLAMPEVKLSNDAQHFVIRN
jgi:hypothetical protein